MSEAVGSAATASVAALHQPSRRGSWSWSRLLPRRAIEIEVDLELLLGEGTSFLFPQREARPYESSEPHLEIGALRVEAVEALLGGRTRLLVTTLRALQERAPIPAELAGLRISLAVGEEVGFQNLIADLAERGFERVPLVEEVGQFAVRGGSSTSIRSEHRSRCGSSFGETKSRHCAFSTSSISARTARSPKRTSCRWTFSGTRRLPVWFPGPFWNCFRPTPFSYPFIRTTAGSGGPSSTGPGAMSVGFMRNSRPTVSRRILRTPSSTGHRRGGEAHRTGQGRFVRARRAGDFAFLQPSSPDPAGYVAAARVTPCRFGFGRSQSRALRQPRAM